MNKGNKTEIEVQCDEDGQTFVVFGTLDKRKALKEMRSFMEHECGLEGSDLPKLDDIYLNPLWYGQSPENPDENWYWWDNPPKNSEYQGSCYRFDF